ncbi:MAG TPA: TRAP transporter small permease subunit [Devosia sp.]|jgi:TRAP-type C4-dicarboxylate transport system permease small subunit|nr:TRAP transporter small permease subunit [Devosia sp.]
MRPLLDWLRARADNVAVALLAAMFISFMVQIASRYVFNTPVAWTLELCLTTWLWVVFWEAAFLMRDGDHIRFDLLYLAARGRTRRTLALLAGIAIIVAFIAALPATYGYISFERIKRSATLRIPLNLVFSIYGVFMMAIIVRYLVRLWRVVRGVDDDQPGGAPGQ